MLVRLAKAKTSIQIFFPIEPMPGSPYANAGRRWQTSSGHPDIRYDLECLLRSDSEVVSGYSVLRTDGVWFNDDTTQWQTDDVCMILAYVPPGFVSDYRDPNNPNSRPRQFLARIGKLSCTQMGHACFWCIFDGNSLEEISSSGMTVGGRVVSFDDILA